MSKQPGIVFWLTGLSGSGKTTIGTELTNHLKAQGKPVVFLDGDQLREITGNTLGHDREQRLAASLLYARLCNLLANQNVNVVCATISLFHETQQWNRDHIKNYMEIFVDVPLAEVIKRDAKQIYSRAQQGLIKNVVGIDIEPEYPQNPDIVIKNHNKVSAQEAVYQILNYLTQAYA